MKTTIYKKTLTALFGLCLATSSGLYATQQPDTPASYDYTLQKFPHQVSPIKDGAYLDIEDIPKELATIEAKGKLEWWNSALKIAT